MPQAFIFCAGDRLILLERGSAMKILRLKQVITMTGLSRSSIYRHGPTRRRVGPNAVGWLESDVVDWMKSRPLIESASVDVSGGFGRPPHL